ncbi:uncharacterized protein UV8b_08035 [Ustilaginoidea virens]|uniref:Uncharacterized protein n=1 Tax=Ustilaginoidea virens TaxID=1159556 RepID=A0A8E5HY48_USTVR|nr:uncharacterized protein UV8b_08035 [Ustilaginoidea virens]QUC23794.1 hypothetical protein UV8b_08035 [Ustilaginoidea virens]
MTAESNLWPSSLFAARDESTALARVKLGSRAPCSVPLLAAAAAAAAAASAASAVAAAAAKRADFPTQNVRGGKTTCIT